jgi:hypothetical protein
VVRTPAGWLDLLERRLLERWLRPVTGMGVCDAYYEGDHNLAFATAKFREAFGTLFASIADNWCQIVVDSPVERMEVQGFRFGSTPGADNAAWDIWQANGLDAESDLVHTEAVKLGEAYWLVEPGASPDDPPTITSEHPSQCIVATAAGNRRQRLAGLKRWVDDADGHVYANVFLPDAVAKFRSVEKRAPAAACSGAAAKTTPAASTSSARCRSSPSATRRR